MNQLRNVAYVLCFGVGTYALTHYRIGRFRFAARAYVPSRAT